jgi:hypothetical protein
VTGVPTLVEVRTRKGEGRWHLLGASGLRMLKPYADFADACQVAGEVAYLVQQVPSPQTATPDLRSCAWCGERSAPSTGASAAADACSDACLEALRGDARGAARHQALEIAPRPDSWAAGVRRRWEQHQEGGRRPLPWSRSCGRPPAGGASSSAWPGPGRPAWRTPSGAAWGPRWRATRAGIIGRTGA